MTQLLTEPFTFVDFFFNDGEARSIEKAIFNVQMNTIMHKGTNK